MYGATTYSAAHTPRRPRCILNAASLGANMAITGGWDAVLWTAEHFGADPDEWHMWLQGRSLRAFYVAEAPWSVAEWAVALRFYNP